MIQSTRPQVVIVGAGFGGLTAARALAGSPAEVVLVDRNNYHTFLPLLYQVAAAELEAEEIGYPVRSILRRLPGVRFVMAEVQGLDLARRVIKTNGPALTYDYLLLAPGSVPNFFGVEGAEQHAFPLYSLEQAIALRSHILRCFEQAVQEPDEMARRRALTFVIIGGGATGVEFAGALAELIHGPLIRDYPALDAKQIQVVLLEAMSSLLPALPDKLREYTHNRLRRMGVEVRLQATVARITSQAVVLQDGSTIATNTVVWTAGVRGNPQVSSWGLPTARGGRVPVLPTLQVAGHPEVYVIGDLAYLEEEGHPVPMVAPAALQQGKRAAQNVMRQMAGEEPLPFHYRDLGTMVTIGRNAAVARLGSRQVTGFFAWVAWLMVHLVRLIGFRNRLFVLLNWAWDYFFFERASRLILPRA